MTTRNHSHRRVTLSAAPNGARLFVIAGGATALPRLRSVLAAELFGLTTSTVRRELAFLVRSAPWRRSIASLSILAASACSDASADPKSEALDALELRTTDSGRNVTIALHRKIDIHLQTIGPGNFENPTISSEVVQFVALEMERMQSPAGPAQLCELEGIAPGSADIELPHSGESEPFRLHVVVE